MTIDEKIKQWAEEYSTTGSGATIEKRECFTVDLHLGNPQQYEYVKVYNNFSYCAAVDGANFLKSEMLSDMQKLVEALELPEMDCGDNSCRFVDRSKPMGMRTNGGCRCLDGRNRLLIKRHFFNQKQALAEFNAKYKEQK